MEEAAWIDGLPGYSFVDDMVGRGCVVVAVDNLGTNSAVVGKQLATGSFPFNSSTTYVISLTFGSGSGKLGVTFSQGSASPLSETFSTGQFTPDAVGYALNDPYDNNAPATIAGFTYEVGS